MLSTLNKQYWICFGIFLVIFHHFLVILNERPRKSVIFDVFDPLFFLKLKFGQILEKIWPKNKISVKPCHFVTISIIFEEKCEISETSPFSP